jgi:hypothetical protein
MSCTTLERRTSKLYDEYALSKKKGKKLKEECCFKYTKKKGKYCKSCPVLHAIANDKRRNF